MNRYLSHLIAFAVILIMVAGCSSQKSNPVTSTNQDSDFSLPVMDTAGDKLNHQLLGTWDINFDLENMNATLQPNREMNVHYNVTLLLPGPQIDIISFDGLTGIVEVDLTIDNPSAIDAYDVRLIIFTDAAGHMLTNSDDWTDLYEQPGGLPINPFKAYATDEPNRIFAGPSSHTEKLFIYLPAGNPNVTFAIDASVPGNCLEPYMIDDFWQEDYLTPDIGSSTYADIYVYDWQDNVSSVYLHCPVITGVDLVLFVRDAVDPDLYYATITNNNGVGAGNYTGYMLAYSSDSGSQAIYDTIRIEVESPPPPAPDYNWAKTWGSTECDYLESITTDSNGSVITCGTFYKTVDFDPDTGVYYLTSNGDEDVFLSKLDLNGHLLWVKSWGGDKQEYANGVAVDDSDYIYVTGRYNSTTDFDPGPGEEIHTPIASGECYLSKFDSSGTFLWVKIWGGLHYSYSSDITIDSSYNLYLSGNFVGTVDFDPGPGVVERTATASNQDGFVSKFDSDGNLLWVNTWGGVNREDVYALEHYNSTELFIVGLFYSECDFDPGPGEDIHTPSLYMGVFLSRWDCDDGSYHWTNVIDGDIVYTNNLAVDDQGDIYIPGVWQEPVDFDPGPGEDIHTPIGGCDGFLTKQNNQGGYEWTKTWGANDIWQCDNAHAATIDPNGSIVVTGSFGMTCDFDPGPDTYYLTSHGYSACYLTALNQNGDFLWAFAFGGSDGDNEGRELISDSNSIYVSGTFMGTTDFDPGPGTDNKSSNGEFDMFVSKYDY